MKNKAIKLDILKDVKLSSHVVTEVLTTDEIKKDDFRLIESGAVYNKLQELEQLLSGYGSDSFSLYKQKNYSNLFNFDDNLTGSVLVEGNIPETYQFVKIANNQPEDVSGSNYLSSKYFRIPSAIKTNNGRLIAVYDIRWQSEQDIARTTYNDQMIGMSYSDDDGKTWSQPKRIINWFMSSKDADSDTTYYQSGVSDPGIIYDSVHNVILVLAVAGKGFAYQSTPYLWSKTGSAIDSAERQQFVLVWSKDNGETWSEPVSINNKIFDNENFNSHNWINDYTYLFSSCGTSITLKNQQIEENNGQILMLTQLHVTPDNSLPTDFNKFQKPSRSQLLKIIPIYSTQNELIDIKCVLVGSKIGELNNGSDEGQICEGPNGELVAIVKSYGEFNNTEYGSYSNSCIRIRIYKSLDLGETWQICGDLTDNNDKICSTLESTARTKPSICYSPKLNAYIASYQLSLMSDTRVYHILRYSKDLISWQVFDTLLPFSTSGYASFVQLNNDSIGIIFEGYSGGSWSGNNFAWQAAKQISYCKYDIAGAEQSIKTNYMTEAGALASGTTKNVQGFSFTLNNFTTKNNLSVDALKIQCTPALTFDFYCVLYESNMSTALSIAQSLSCSQVSCDAQLSDINMFYTFQLDKTIELQNNFKEYFVRFVRNGTSLPQDGTRGTLPTTQNDGIILPTILSKKSSSGMNVYVSGQIQCVPKNIQIATDTAQSYPTHILVGFKEV